MDDGGGPPHDASTPRRFRPVPAWASLSTRLVHGGQLPDLNAGAVVPPIYQTTTFRFPAAFSEAAGHGEVRLYSREGNPTVDVPTEVVRQLEGGGAARLFASGMGAISATLLSLLKAGDEVVAPAGLYGGTSDLLRSVLPRFGVRVRLLDARRARNPEEEVPRTVRLALLETPSNPTLRVHDIRRWSDVVHRAGGLLVVDNTFASPINQRPIGLGADVVVHSASKYLGGHSDLTAGIVVGSSAVVETLDPAHHFGAPLDPFAAFLLQRSLRTLALRVERQNRSAAEIVRAVASDPAVETVHYPGRASAEEEEIAARQMCGRGGMLALSLRGGAPAAHRFLGALQIVQVAASLGGVESLVSVPRETSHRPYSDAERAELGIDDGLVRLSIGIEDPQDLVRDLQGALERARGGRPPVA